MVLKAVAFLCIWSKEGGVLAMKIRINIEEALLLDAMKDMRKVYQMPGDAEEKAEKIQSIFSGVMHLLDAAGSK